MDETGNVYGRLTVIGRADNIGNGCAAWLCRCECGTEKVIRGISLRKTTSSCGCLKKEGILIKHGCARTHNKHYLYSLWGDIKKKTSNPTSNNFHKYGARGISMFPEWKESFETFRDYIEKHLGPRPEGMSLHRPDNDGNYEPGNVEWATPSTQARIQRLKPSSSSQYRGVRWQKAYPKWYQKSGYVVYITLPNGKRKFIGSFDAELEAAIARDKAVTYYKTGDILNFPEPVSSAA